MSITEGNTEKALRIAESISNFPPIKELREKLANEDKGNDDGV
jgi:hypothetical protein